MRTASHDRRVAHFLVLSVLMGAAVVAIGTRQPSWWLEPPRIVELVSRGATFIDVRNAYSFRRKTLPGAVNIPALELADRLDEVPRDRPVVVFGFFSGDSTGPYRMLASRGFDVHDLGTMNRFPKVLQGHGHAHAHDHDHAEHAGRATP